MATCEMYSGRSGRCGRRAGRRARLAERNRRAGQRLVRGDPGHDDARLRERPLHETGAVETLGPSPPQTYGRPRLLSAALSIVTSCAAVMAPLLGRWCRPGGRRPAAGPAPRRGWETSGSTTASRGSTGLIGATSLASWRAAR